MLFGLLWLFACSGLIYYSWNKVITTMTRMKAVKYWQVLLVMVTICTLCLPCSMRKYSRCYGKKSCPMSQHCDHERDDEEDAKPKK